METRTSVADSLRIFRHTLVEHLYSIILFEAYSIEIAGTEAASAAHAMIKVYMHFFCFGIEYESAVRTFPHTSFAASAFSLLDERLAACVLLCFSGTASAAPFRYFLLLRR